MGSSEEVMSAAISLVVSIIIAIMLVMYLGPPWDMIVDWLGTTGTQSSWMATVQGLFGAFYSLVLLWVIVSFVWFIKVTIKRAEYTSELNQYY